jgi:hypothetical protein
VHEFSRVDLFSGRRTIAVLSRPGDQPVLAITFWRPGERTATARLLLHHGAAPTVAVEAAVRVARNPNFTEGRRHTGSCPIHDVFLSVSASRIHGTDHRAPPCVLIGWTRADGTPQGRPMALKGLELDALEAALATLSVAALESTGRSATVQKALP